MKELSNGSRAAPKSSKPRLRVFVGFGNVEVAATPAEWKGSPGGSRQNSEWLVKKKDDLRSLFVLRGRKILLMNICYALTKYKMLGLEQKSQQMCFLSSQGWQLSRGERDSTNSFNSNLISAKNPGAVCVLQQDGTGRRAGQGVREGILRKWHSNRL